MIPEAASFASEWIDAWNSRELARILSHYSEDVALTSPMIRLALGRDLGTLHGKTAVGEYWAEALKKFPDLRFELIKATRGVDSIALCYKSAMNKTAIELMFFNDQGKVNRVLAHYD